jgi:hypothetical protein
MPLMYRCPGPHAGPEGKTYEFKGFPSKADGLAAGFFVTLPDAVAGKKSDPVAIIPAEDAPPTRAEIEEQAKKVGVKVDGRMSDKTLLKLIDDAMKPKE